MPRDDLKDFARWLNGQMYIHQINQLELARKLGVSDSGVNRWCKGMRAPTPEHARALARLFNTREVEVLKLVGRLPDDLIEENPTPLGDKLVDIPLLGENTPGGLPHKDMPRHAEQKLHITMEVVRMLIGDAVERGLRLFAVRVRGDMLKEEGIGDGDVAVFSPDVTVGHGELAVVEIEGAGRVVRKTIQAGNKIVLQGSAGKDAAVYDASQVRLLGRVMLHLGSH